MRKDGTNAKCGRWNGKTQPQFDPESQPGEELPESKEGLEVLPLSKDGGLLGVESKAE